VEPTLALWREKQWPVSYLQANPKRAEMNGVPTKSFVRYDGYKGATTIAQFPMTFVWPRHFSQNVEK